MKKVTQLLLVLMMACTTLLVPQDAIAGCFGGHGFGGGGGFGFRFSFGGCNRGFGGCRRRVVCRGNCFGAQFARRTTVIRTTTVIVGNGGGPIGGPGAFPGGPVGPGPRPVPLPARMI